MSLGRIASKAASLLMEKDSTQFSRNKIEIKEVCIFNVSKLNIKESKKIQKKYKWYSGYPGGLREESMDTAIAKKGNAYVLRRAVNGMLPKNKLRSKMIKQLKIID